MKGDLNQFAGEKTASDKDYQQPISKGQFHTLLSFAKSCDNFLLNFEPENIKLNESVLKEMI